MYRQSHIKSCSVENNEYIKIEGRKLQVEPIHHYQSSFHNQRDIKMQDTLKKSPVRHKNVQKKTIDMNLKDLGKIPLKNRSTFG